MATCTHAVSTASTSNASSYASGAFTPAIGDLLCVLVTASDTIQTVGTTLSGTGGVTFALDFSVLFRTSLDRIFFFVANSLCPTASSQTVTFDCTGDAATGAIIQVVRIAGMSRAGTDATRQAGTQANAGAGTPAPAFGLAALTGNPTIGLIGNSTNPATMTTPVGWTEANDTGYATPTTGAEYVTRNSGFTGTTVTWGSASASAFASMVVELDASVPSDAALEMKQMPQLIAQ